MAAKKKKAARRRKQRTTALAPVKPGTMFAEGIAVETSEPDDNTDHKMLVWLGRVAGAAEQPAAGERVVFVQGKRVFFSDAQSGIDAAALHRLPASPSSPSRPSSPSTPGIGTAPAGTGPFFELFRDVGDGWRWRIQARNGRALADSGEAYSSKTEAQAAIDRLNNADWPLAQAKDA